MQASKVAFGGAVRRSVKFQEEKIVAYHSFEDLEVWKRACQVAVDVYELLKNSRDFAFRDQMIRSSLSISSNIAEGAERGSNPDFIRFLHYSKGSAAELRSQVSIASQVGILSPSDKERLSEEAVELSRMLQGLINSITRQS